MGYVEGILCKLGISFLYRAGRFLINWVTRKFLKRQMPRWVWWIVSWFIGDLECEVCA